MSLVVLLLEALVYSFNLAVILITWLSAYRLPADSPERSRLRAWNAVLLNALCIASVFFLQQTSYLMRDWVDTGGFWLVFDIGTELAFVGTTLWVLLLFERFFSLASDRKGAAVIRFILRLAFVVLAGVYATSFIIHLPDAEVRLATGSAVGWPDLVSFGVGTFFMLLLGLYYKVPKPESVHFLSRGLLWMILGTIALELLVFFLPESVWGYAVYSRYFFETILIYAGLLTVSLLYALKESGHGVFSHSLSRDRGQEVSNNADEVRLTVQELCASLELSARELEVVACLLKGMSNQQIADSLYISLSTVKTHLHRILDKSGQPSRTALVAWLGRNGPEKPGVKPR